MRRVRHALGPGGLVAILEYRPEARAPGPPVRYRLAAEEVTREMEEAGFTLRTRWEFLPREYFLVFEVAGRPGPAAAAGP